MREIECLLLFSAPLRTEHREDVVVLSSPWLICSTGFVSSLFACVIAARQRELLLDSELQICRGEKNKEFSLLLAEKADSDKRGHRRTKRPKGEKGAWMCCDDKALVERPPGTDLARRQWRVQIYACSRKRRRNLLKHFQFLFFFMAAKKGHFRRSSWPEVDLAAGSENSSNSGKASPVDLRSCSSGAQLHKEKEGKKQRKTV